MLLSLIVIYVSKTCVFVLSNYAIHYLNSLKNMKICLACYFVLYTVYYWGAGLNPPNTTTDFPANPISSCAPRLWLTVTRCIVRSLQRAIKQHLRWTQTHQSYGYTHTHSLSHISLSQISLSHWDVEERMLQNQSQWTVNGQHAVGFCSLFMACDRQTIRLSTTVGRVPLIGFNVSVEGLNTLWIVTQTFSAHSRHFPHFYLVIFIILATCEIQPVIYSRFIIFFLA